MVLTEAVILGWLGVLLGSFLGSGIVAWWGHTGLSMVLSSEEDVADMALYGVSFSGHLYPYLERADFLPGFIGIVVVSIAAAFWPALATARLEPIEAMRS